MDTRQLIQNEVGNNIQDIVTGLLWLQTSHLHRFGFFDKNAIAGISLSNLVSGKVAVPCLYHDSLLVCYFNKAPITRYMKKTELPEDYDIPVSWYIITDWLAEKLIAKNAVVIRADNYYIWGNPVGGMLLENHYLLEEIAYESSRNAAMVSE